MSRTQARKRLSPEFLAHAVGDRTWLAGRPGSLVDEHPDAYEDTNQVMRDRAGLVSIRVELRQVLNDKD